MFEVSLIIGFILVLYIFHLAVKLVGWILGQIFGGK